MTVILKGINILTVYQYVLGHVWLGQKRVIPKRNATFFINEQYSNINIIDKALQQLVFLFNDLLVTIRFKQFYFSDVVKQNNVPAFLRGSIGQLVPSPVRQLIDHPAFDISRQGAANNPRMLGSLGDIVIVIANFRGNGKVIPNSFKVPIKEDDPAQSI